jgi:hypothetical protein
MGALGHWHRSVSIWDDAGSIAKQIDEMAPDVIWTHVIAWPPIGATPAADLLEIVGRHRRRGACVYLHDGDPRERKVDGGLDIAAAFSVALVNRAVPAQWPLPSLRWPYAAMPQTEIAPAREEWACDLLFCGHMRREGEGYKDRTDLVWLLSTRLGRGLRIVSPGRGDVNNRLQVADVAPSVGAVLGYGRPDVKGWVDTRVFQWPGAGGVLLHTDGGHGILVEDQHFLRFDPKNGVDSVLAALARVPAEGPGIRARAFGHIQSGHTWRHRVEEALAFWYEGRA